MRIRSFGLLALFLALIMPAGSLAKEDAMTEQKDEALSRGSIAIILTSHDRLGVLYEPTGFWYEEMTAPYYVFREAGYDVILASVRGGEVQADPRSEDRDIPSVSRFLDDEDAMERLKETVTLEQLDAEELDAIYLAGGHGTMWDFPGSDALRRLVLAMDEAGRPIAAVCHGPAAFIHLTDEDGSYWVAGRRLTGFTDEEEVQGGYEDVMPFLLEKTLRSRGAEFTEAAPFEPHVVRDGILVTGQNPASSEEAAKQVLSLLPEKPDTDTDKQSLSIPSEE